jgi:hypothetical protein
MKYIISESQWPRIRQKNIDEDLFLKKDPKENKLVIFSDKTEKNARTKETIALAKEFRKLGFDWRPELGHWIGDYSKLETINNLISSHNKIREIIHDLSLIEDFIADTDADPTKMTAMMDNLDSYVKDLANATDQTTMDAAIRNYLTFYSRFHSYSLVNTWLIYLQKKDATKVAGYDTWKKSNRGVKKGATAIWIRYPMQIKKGAEVDTSGVDFTPIDDAVRSGQSFTKFSWGKIYDISDTYALNEKGDIPETPKWFAENEPSEVADMLIERLKQFCETIGIKLTMSDSKGGEKGYSAGDHINLSSDISGVGQASTFVHEMAHELLHWKTKSPFHIDDEDANTREMKELQAESVSYVVLKHYNLPVKQHPTYLALWRANKDKVMKNLQVIVKCSKYIIDGIDAMEESQEAQVEISEMGENDVNLQRVLKHYDEGDDDFKRKVSMTITGRPNSDRAKINWALREMGYLEIMDVQFELDILNLD